jgi:hypothetical protein
MPILRDNHVAPNGAPRDDGVLVPIAFYPRNSKGYNNNLISVSRNWWFLLWFEWPDFVHHGEIQNRF